MKDLQKYVFNELCQLLSECTILEDGTYRKTTKMSKNQQYEFTVKEGKIVGDLYFYDCYETPAEGSECVVNACFSQTGQPQKIDYKKTFYNSDTSRYRGVDHEITIAGDFQSGQFACTYPNGRAIRFYDQADVIKENPMDWLCKKESKLFFATYLTLLGCLAIYGHCDHKTDDHCSKEMKPVPVQIMKSAKPVSEHFIINHQYA